MVQRAGEFDAKGTGHAPESTAACLRIQDSKPDPEVRDLTLRFRSWATAGTPSFTASSNACCLNSALNRFRLTLHVHGPSEHVH